jgi:ATP-binding cassette subfamily B (MDR/TAP) protein 6
VLIINNIYDFQVVLNASVSVICILTLIVELFVFKPGILYGYMILTLLQAIISWPMVITLIIWERKYMLPTPPSRGHGIILLLFWTGVFALQNLMILNIQNPQWFFEFKNFQDAIYFSLFLARYICLGGIFLLGLKAPGIPSIRHSESYSRLNLPDDSNASQPSPFSNLWKKLKMLAPFMWPSKSIGLQLCVISSVSLLIFGRLTNVFVPLYSKKIGEFRIFFQIKI